MLRGYSVLHRLVLPKRNQHSQSIYFGINFWIYKHFYLGYIAQAEVGAEGPERTGGTENPLARRLARYSTPRMLSLRSDGCSERRSPPCIEGRTRR